MVYISKNISKHRLPQTRNMKHAIDKTTQNGVIDSGNVQQNPEAVPHASFYRPQKRVFVLCWGRPPRQIWLLSLEKQNTGETVAGLEHQSKKSSDKVVPD